MQRVDSKWIVIGSLAAPAFALVLAGCVGNRADEGAQAGPTASTAAAVATQPAAQVERKVDEPAPAAASDVETERSAARAREAASRERELERRVLELERQIAEASPRSPAPAAAASVLAAPVAELRPIRVTLPAATPLEVQIATTLSSETSFVGDSVDAVVIRDVLHEGRAVIPAGSRLYGTVTDVAAAKKIGGQARLAIDFDRLDTGDGGQLALRAHLDSVARSQKTKDAATIGGSAAGGALLGRVLSDDHRSRGTVLGALVGAAVGTAIAANNNAESIRIEAGTQVELQLDAPLELAVESAPAGVLEPRS